jgi:hypothetical protein
MFVILRHKQSVFRMALASFRVKLSGHPGQIGLRLHLKLGMHVSERLLQ